MEAKTQFGHWCLKMTFCRNYENHSKQEKSDQANGMILLYPLSNNVNNVGFTDELYKYLKLTYHIYLQLLLMGITLVQEEQVLL